MNNRGWWLALAGGLAIFALLAWLITVIFPAQPGAPATSEPEAPAEAEAAPEVPTDAADPDLPTTLYFGSADGGSLVAVRQAIVLTGTPVEQGRQLLAAQLAGPVPSAYISVIPDGTTLRDFYLTDRGDAFLDLSGEIVSGHPGGSLNELLTVYALVNAVTTNLPQATRVQILVEGREVDTIAGHVDLRRPLTRDPSLVRAP